jgi:hypothetical protein
MNRANAEVYDKLGKVRKEVVRKSNTLREVVATANGKREKAVERASEAKV